MKENNQKGFTLIELLAVITIMGILMVVAIPAVTRTIENSRKDTFINTVQNYVNGARNMWMADNLSCNMDAVWGNERYVSSAVPAGTYYIEVDSSDESVPQLLESGGKSPWGSREMKGYILVHVQDVTNAQGATTRKVDFYPVIVDGVHGVNVTSSGERLNSPSEGLTKSEDLKRGNLIMSGAVYDHVITFYIMESPTGDVPILVYEAPQSLVVSGNTIISDATKNSGECIEV